MQLGCLLKLMMASDWGPCIGHLGQALRWAKQPMGSLRLGLARTLILGRLCGLPVLDVI